MMKTHRLYYQDAYLTSFESTVVAVREHEIALDETAFYPTSGGQPFDTGTFLWDEKTISVTDVNVENDVVWHRVDVVPPVGSRLQGMIDWQRRFDHMQQHAGDHMIAGAVWQLFRGVTIGLHTSAQQSTIDIAMPEGRCHLTKDEIMQLETLVNTRIQQDAPIRCWFPDERELTSLPLRKKPTVNEHIRIVAMGDYEMVACGGTHPSSTGQIGPVKILSTAPARGQMRLTFLAGMRAIRHYQACHACADEVATRFSADVHTASQSLERWADAQLQALKDMNQRLLSAAMELLSTSVQQVSGVNVYACHLPFADAVILQQAAKALIGKPHTLVLLSCPRDVGALLLFARSADETWDMAALLRSTGARGGGKPDFAQGSAQDTKAVEAAFQSLL